MNTPLNTRALALAGAVTGGVIAALCFAIYAVLGWPDPWMDLFIGAGPSVAGWLIGIAESAAVVAFSGWLVAACYNRFVRPAAAAR
jgi:hypothetical protein